VIDPRNVIHGFGEAYGTKVAGTLVFGAEARGTFASEDDTQERRGKIGFLGDFDDTRL
jgi:hypothetical protein